MSPPLSRRHLLIGGGTVIAALLGGTIVHAYTGPVSLHFFNHAPTDRHVELTLSSDGQTAFNAEYNVPPTTGDDVGELFDERIIDTAIRGTTYRVSLTLNGQALDDTWTYTPSCTGYSGRGGEPHTDELHIDLLADAAPDEVQVIGDYCGSILG